MTVESVDPRARVDAHVHVWPPEAGGGDARLAAAGSTDALARQLAAAQVRAAVVVQPAVSGLDHSYLLESIRSGLIRAVGVAQVDPADDRSFRVVSELAEEPDVVGFRLPLLRAAPGWLRRHGRDYSRLASSAGAIVSLLLAPEHLSEVERLVADHPDVPVMIDHLARIDRFPDRAAAVDRLCRLASAPNVYVKVSALDALSAGEWPYRDVWSSLVQAVEAFGSKRLVWGSDYPFVLYRCTYADSIRAVEQALAGLPGAAVADVFGGNALRIFFASRHCPRKAG